MRFKTPDLAISSLVFGVPLLLYSQTLAPSITPGDSGELVAAAATLGIPHPPGYALWLLIQRVFILGLGGDPARAAAIGSALAGSLACVVLYTVGVRLVGNRLAAAAGALLFAVIPAHWSQALVAEVYSLGTLLGLLMLWAWLRAGKRGDKNAFGLAAYLTGLAVVAHYTNLLLLPGAFVLAGRKAFPVEGRPRAAGFFFLGLSPTLILMLRARHDPIVNWGDPSTFSRWWAHLTREQYGGGGLLESANPFTTGEATNQLGRYFGGLLDQFGIAPVLLAAAGGIWLWNRSRRIGLGVLLLFLFAGPVLQLSLRPDPHPALREEMLVFCRLSYAAVALCVGAGLLWVAREAAKFRGRLAPAIVGIVFAGSLVLVALQGGATRRQNDSIARALGEDILTTLPENSLLLVDSDNYHYAVLYLQVVDGKRPDVEMHDVRGLPRTVWTNLAKMAERPVYVTSLLSGRRIPGTLLLPHGILYRVVREGARGEAVRQILESNAWERYKGFRAGWSDVRGRFLKALYFFHRGEAALVEAEQEGAERYGRVEDGTQGGGPPGPGNVPEAAKADTFVTGASPSPPVPSDPSREVAVEFYRQAGHLGEGIPEIHLLLATRYSMLGRLGEAADQYRGLLAVDEKNVEAHYRLGWALEGLERPIEAARHYRRVIDLDPSSPFAAQARRRLAASSP
jgi:tetratricopeptide (TPR) repeat protein